MYSNEGFQLIGVKACAEIKNSNVRLLIISPKTSALKLPLKQIVATLLKILVFHLSGYRPQESKGSIIRVPVSQTKEYAYGAWSVKIAQVNRENVRLQVTPPADAVVGRYQFYVETKTNVSGTDKQAEFRYQYPEEIIILFNPWCKG